MLDKAGKIFNSQNLVLAVFYILAFALIINTFKVIQRNYALQQRVNQLTDEVALVELENQNLKYNIAYYKTDDYLEIEAKRILNVANKGEGVFLLEKDGDPEPGTKDSLAREQTRLLNDRSNFDKWMIFLFGKAN